MVANMSKACNTEEEAKATVQHFQEKGTECYYVKDADKYLVYRTSDNKTLKSIFYSPADLEGVLKY